LDISFNVSLVVNGRKYENINVVKHREDMIEKLDPHAYFMRKK
jgi:hypothetical protein